MGRGYKLSFAPFIWSCKGIQIIVWPLMGREYGVVQEYQLSFALFIILWDGGYKLSFALFSAPEPMSVRR